MKELFNQRKACLRILLLTIIGLWVPAGTPVRAFTHVFSTDGNMHAVNGLLGGADGLDSTTRVLRLKLCTDVQNEDDIVIAFNAGASSAYNSNVDARHFPFYGPVTLCSYSSDGIALSVNFLPLPGQGSEVIRLDADAQNSGSLTLRRTELDSLPPNYGVWLVDKYLKDSVNLRTDSSYTFAINKADTATFGGYRFSVVVINSAPPFRLLGFNAVKGTKGAELSWTAQNEGKNTRFEVQRSTDGGATFRVIDSLVSSSAGAYNFTDPKPPLAWDDYRLKCTDNDGAVSYSNLVTLLYEDAGDNPSPNVSVYPNPVSDMVTVSVSGANAGYANQMARGTPTAAFTHAATAHVLAAAPGYTIRIISITGRIVRNVTSLSQSWQDNIANLNPGTYIIEVFNKSDDSVVGRKTMIKM